MTPGEPLAAPRLPDFFIVGAPKCGTTAMYTWLGQHPGIFMPFHKEPLFFGADLTRRYGPMSEGEYLALFEAARPDQRVGEASAWYLYSASAATEIHAAVPEAAIIIMLRNPVDVMHAQHSQLLFNRQEEIEDFGEALAAEEDRVQGRRLPRRSHRPENLFYRRMVRFADQIERYLDVFGRDRVHVIVHDDLRSDPGAVYRQTLRFLGVEDSFAPAFERVNENKGVRNPIVQRLVWDPPLLRRLIPVLRRYPLVHRLRAAVLTMNSRVERRRPMDPQLRRRLLEEHRGEIERVGALIGRDLRDWVSDPGTGD